MDLKIERCPYCASANVSASEGQHGDGRPFFYVECEECEAMGPPTDHDKVVAIARWNHRWTGGDKCEATTQARFNHPSEQCKYRAIDGSRFCRKHQPHDPRNAL